MLGFLGQLDHLPCRGENCLVALLLPELDVELPIWEIALHQPCFPLGLFRIAHLLCSAHDHKVVSFPNIPGFSYFTASTYTGMRCTPSAVGAKT